METKDKKICIKRKGKHDTKYKYCISESSIPDKLKVDEDEVLGQGSYGVVIAASMGDQKYALKIVPIDVEIPSEDCGYVSDGGDCVKFSSSEFMKEAKISKEFGEIGITPRVLFSEIVDLSKFKSKPKDQKDNLLPAPSKIGVLILERFGKSLENIIRSDDVKIYMENKDLIYSKILKLLKILYDMGYTSMDSHFGNIIYDIEKRDVKLIDLDLDPITISWDDVKDNFASTWDFEEERHFRKAGLLDKEEPDDGE